MNNFVNIDIPDQVDGHKKIMVEWETGDDIHEKEAQNRIQTLFLELQKEGYKIYSVKKRFGFFKKKGDEIKDYDPKTGEFIYEQFKPEKEHKEIIKNAEKKFIRERNEKEREKIRKEIEKNRKWDKKTSRWQNDDVEEVKENKKKKYKKLGENEYLSRKETVVIETKDNRNEFEEYKKLGTTKEQRSVSMKEIERDQREIRYQEKRVFSPEKEKVDMNKDYVATVPMRRG